MADSRGGGRAGLLSRRWLHSHEEDTEGETVYRPAEFDFPPSRGRSGFSLAPGGAMVDVGIAPTDGPLETVGSWELDPRSRLVLRREGEEHERVLEIVSIDEDRLVVRKSR